MSHPASPAEFAIIDDVEFMSVRTDMQLLCYSFLDPAMTPQERYALCLHTDEKVMAFFVKLVHQGQASAEEAALLQAIILKQEEQLAVYQRRLQAFAADTRGRGAVGAAPRGGGGA